MQFRGQTWTPASSSTNPATPQLPVLPFGQDGVHLPIQASHQSSTYQAALQKHGEFYTQQPLDAIGISDHQLVPLGHVHMKMSWQAGHLRSRVFLKGIKANQTELTMRQRIQPRPAHWAVARPAR